MTAPSASRKNHCGPRAGPRTTAQYNRPRCNFLVFAARDC